MKVLFFLVIDEFKDDGNALEVREREKKQAKKKILLFIIVFYFWLVKQLKLARNYNNLHLSLFHFSSWLVNVVDGFILVIYHLVEKGALAPSVKQTFLYKPAYIYTVWIIEVRLTTMLHTYA